MYDAILTNIRRHIDLDADETRYFTGILRPRDVARRDFLLREGEICRYETYVVRGCLRNYYLDAGGREHILQFSVEDWWTSDLYSLLTQTPATQFIDALEDTRLLQIDRADLEALYRAVPKFERFFRIMLQNAFIAQQQRILHNIGTTADDRYQRFLQKYPGLEQRVAQHQIAAYLGITPEFLSKIRGKRGKGEG